MTALPVDEIERAAVEVDFARGARRVVAALFYYPSWLVGASVRGMAWCVAACKVGYRDGRRIQPPRASQAMVMPDRTTR